MKKILLLVFIAFLVGCKPHEHTPLVRKAYDDQYHWNVASCGHDVKLNQALHVLIETIIEEPTETNEGLKIYKCQECGYEKEEVIPKLKHEHSYYEYDCVLPTCETQGYTIYRCDCGDEYFDKYVDAEHQVSTYANYDDEFHWYQSTCGHEIEIKKEAHNLVDGACSCGYSVNTLSFLLEGDEYTVIGYEQLVSSTLIIPSAYNGKPVTKIASEAFKEAKEIKKLIVSEGIKTIEKAAFENCRNLLSYSLPSTLTSAIDNVFSGCIRLVERKFYSDRWGNNTIDHIITFGDTKTSVVFDGDFAYIKYKELDRYCLVGYFGSDEVLELPKSFNGLPYDIYSYTFYNSENLKELIIPTDANIETIYENALYGLSLNSLYLPKTIKSAKEALNNTSCENLYFNGTLIDWCGIELSSQDLDYPEKYLYGSDKSLTDSVINFYIKENNEYTKLEGTLIIPSEIKVIGHNQFSGLSSITEVIIHKDVEVIAAGAFRNCYNLKTVTIEQNSNLKCIGSHAFKNCILLENITIPTTLEAIVSSNDNHWLVNCNNLKNVYFQGGISEWISFTNLLDGHYTASPMHYASNIYFNIDGSYKLATDIVIPEDTEEISSYSFYNFKHLETAIIPDVKTIGDSIFNGCDKLHTIHYDGYYDVSKMNFGFDIAIYVLVDGEYKLYEDFICVEIDGEDDIEKVYYNPLYDDITEIYLPSNVISISTRSIESKVERIYYDGTFENWLDISFIYNGFYSGTIYFKEEPVTSLDVPEYISFVDATYLSAFKDVTELHVYPSNADYVSFASLVNLNTLYYHGTVEQIKESSRDLESYLNMKYDVYVLDENGEFYLLTDGTIDCENEEVIYLENITELKTGSLKNASSAHTIYIPKSVIYFESDLGLSNELKNVYYGGTIEDWCKITFNDHYANIAADAKLYLLDDNCEYYELTDIVIPKSITKINNYQFWTSFKEYNSLTVHEGVTEVGEDILAFGETVIYNYSALDLSMYKIITDVDPNTSDFIFQETTDGYRLMKYIGTDTIVTLPDDYNGHKYIVDENAFSYRLIKLIVPESISIDWNFDNYEYKAWNRLVEVCFLDGDPNKHPGRCALSMVYDINETNLIYDGDYLFASNEAKDYYCLVDYLGQDKDLVLPSEINGKPYNIENSAFRNNHFIESVVIPNGVVEIGYYAFYNCANLRSVTLPSSLDRSASYAFSECENLETVYYNGTLKDYCRTPFIKSVEGSPLENIKNFYLLENDQYVELVNVVIPDGVTNLYSNMFNNINSIKTVTIPKTLTNLPADALPSIDKIYLPSTLLSLGTSRAHINEMYYDGTISEFIQIDFGVVDVEEVFVKVNGEYKSLKTMTIPYTNDNINTTKLANLNIKHDVIILEEGIKKIYMTNDAEKVYLPKSLEKVDKFSGDVEELYFAGDLEQFLNLFVFSGGTWGKMGRVNRFFMMGENGEYQEVKELVIPASCTVVNDDFVYFKGIESIVIPKTMEHVMTPILNDDTALKKVYFNGTILDWCKITFTSSNANPMSVASEFYLLDDNNEYCLLEELVIPNGVTKIGDYQFYNFKQIKSITWNDALRVIGKEAFFSLTQITEVLLPNSLQELGNKAFNECSNLKKLYLPNSITELSGSAFVNNDNLRVLITEFSFEELENRGLYLSNEIGLYFVDGNKVYVRHQKLVNDIIWEYKDQKLQIIKIAK